LPNPPTVLPVSFILLGLENAVDTGSVGKDAAVQVLIDTGGVSRITANRRRERVT
jgi:hypothetical protein